MASDGKTPVETKTPTRSIYVAGKWADRERIHKVIQLLQSFGHRITHDWTQVETGTRTLEFNQMCAGLDVKGVLDSDIVIADMTDPNYRYQGTCTEIGAAQGANMLHELTGFPDSRIEIWYIGELRHGVFFSKCKHFTDWQQVLRTLHPQTSFKKLEDEYTEVQRLAGKC